MLLSTYLHRVKETKSIENGAPGPREGLRGGVRLTAGTTYLPNVFA